MSNPSTPTKGSNSKSKSKSKSRQRKKRRNSNNSNASIISIDPVSLKNLRAFQAKVAKENKKQKALYLQQKKSKFQDYSNKYIATELKEDDEYYKPSHDDYDEFETNKEMYSVQYDTPSSKASKESVESQMENITVEELLPLIKNLVDRHNNLQEEYDNLNRELREQRIVFEDKITELEREQIDLSFEQMNDYDITERPSFSDSKQQMVSVKNMRREYEDKINHLKNNYENNLLSIQSQYTQEIETQKKEITTLHKELNDADKENDALRQTLDALEHDNQSLRISMNNSNKQFQNIKLYQNKNKALLLENETLKEQMETLEQEMEIMFQEQEEQEEEMSKNNYINQNTAGTKSNPNQRPQTPTHAYTRTVVQGTRDTLDIGSNKGISDHDSSTMGNDLLHQIGDEIMQSSADPPDRGSNYGDDQASVEYDDDEKKINDDNGSRNTIANLSKFKKIGMDPDSMQQIMALLQEKEKKRHGPHSHPSQDVIDNYSVESNYSDSQQKLEEQIDGIEDDIRELKDMVLSLMDSTNNLQPSINANLGPIIRKINRMYVMLSGPIGPIESRTSQLDENGSIRSYRHIPYDPDHPSSEHSLNTKSSGDTYSQSWIAFLTPYVNDWMPSIGFSAIILSTMYLLIKYHRGRFIGIGQPRVLRNKRK